MRIVAVAFAVLVLAWSSAVPAAWHQARSKHFVIYANESPKVLHEFATKLERFDQAARIVLNMPDPNVGDGNRLTIFVMPSVKDVQQLAGDTSAFLHGFYTGRATGPLAYIARDKGNADLILFHEYTHHLMMQQLDRSYPEWYVEGFAEFFSTVEFDRNGSIWFGAPAQHRARTLFDSKSMPVETLLGGSYGDLNQISKDEREAIYAWGWLVTHYLLTDDGRSAQLVAYINDIAQGASQLAAARTAFGDFSQMDKDLRAYRNKPLLKFAVRANRINLGPIEVEPLSEGAAEMILLAAKLAHGQTKAAAEAVLPQIRSAASRFPGDEFVQLTLARVEIEAGNADRAEAAADRALLANPRNSQAMIYKGRAVGERGGEAADDGQRQALFQQARNLFIAANQIDVEDPEPLYEFYRSFLLEGVRPTDNAISALHYAAELAPQDVNLRMNSALAYLQEGKVKEARARLQPVAFSPHASGASKAARAMIAKIDSGDAAAAITAARSN